MRFMFDTNLKPTAQKESAYIFEIIKVKNSFPWLHIFIAL